MKMQDSIALFKKHRLVSDSQSFNVQRVLPSLRYYHTSISDLHKQYYCAEQLDRRIFSSFYNFIALWNVELSLDYIFSSSFDIADSFVSLIRTKNSTDSLWSFSKFLPLKNVT